MASCFAAVPPLPGTDPTKDYVHFDILLIRTRLGETADAQKEFNAYILSISPFKTNDWTTIIAHFLLKLVDEKEFSLVQIEIG